MFCHFLFYFDLNFLFLMRCLLLLCCTLTCHTCVSMSVQFSLFCSCHVPSFYMCLLPDIFVVFFVPTWKCSCLLLKDCRLWTMQKNVKLQCMNSTSFNKRLLLSPCSLPKGPVTLHGPNIYCVSWFLFIIEITVNLRGSICITQVQMHKETLAISSCFFHIYAELHA